MPRSQMSDHFGQSVIDELLENAVENGYDMFSCSAEEIAEDMKNCSSHLDDQPVERLVPYIESWRRSKVQNKRRIKCRKENGVWLLSDFGYKDLPMRGKHYTLYPVDKGVQLCCLTGEIIGLPKYRSIDSPREISKQDTP